MKRKLLFSSAGVFAAVVLGLAILGIKPGTALAAQPYVPSDLISNQLFTNSGSMSPADIQTFLNNENSGIAGLKDTEACDSNDSGWYAHCSQNLSAAQLIYDAGQVYGVSPRVILATLQKEQSLVTDPNPTQSAIDCAMGYNSCSGVVGFFTQVDWGTYTLRYNYEGALQHATWLSFHPAANYPCRAATSLYSAGLYPGNTVTFADPGGVAETITLANAATASLYCYTPYVGPLSTTGYSGSYNFVQSYENWWGSTQGADYAFQYVSAAFSGASTSASVQGNTQVTVTITAENIGNQSWSNTNFPVRIGTWAPTNHQSALYDPGWNSYNRPATLNEPVVQSGQNGTFTFKIDVPNRSGQYQEMFNLVAEGAAWMNDGFSLELNITPSVYSWSMSSQASSNGWTLLPGQTSQLTLRAKNTGNVTWTNTGNPVRLATWNPAYRNSPFCSDNTNWVAGCYRAATLQESSVAPGGTGTFVFTVQAPQKEGFYAERYNLVMEGVSWFQDPWMEFDINVQRITTWHMVSESSSAGWTLNKGQLAQFTLVAHNDGNLTWTNTNNPVRLATWNPAYRNSPFCSDNTNWVAGCYRAATLKESSVPPGQNGTFEFTVQAPQKTGFYAERFNLVMEGVAWFTDPWLEFDVTVK